jgi:hypothetical protein
LSADGGRNISELRVAAQALPCPGFQRQPVHAPGDPPDSLGGGHAGRDVDDVLAGGSAGLADEAVGGRLQVQDPGTVGVSGLFLAVAVAAVENTMS